MFPWKDGSGLSNVEATDSETTASLLNPSCGITSNIHFEIEDSECTSLGILEGHKNIMALKSPVFKAMFYGPMKETGDLIRIKDSSMLAFQTMLKYIYDVKTDWGQWDLDMREVFRVADLAERYNLPGLERKTIDYAEDFLFPEHRLIEMAGLAEQFAVYTDVANALLNNCIDYLTTIIETPQDVNKFINQISTEEGPSKDVALRLLGRVDFDQLAFVHVNTDLPHKQEIISHLRNINIAIQPRHRLQKLKAILEGAEDGQIIGCIRQHSEDGFVFIKSLRICQKKDTEKAALEGIPLKKDTLVEDRFTHEASVRLHLDMLMKTTPKVTRRNGQTENCIASAIAKLACDSIPEVKTLFIDWLIERFR